MPPTVLVRVSHPIFHTAVNSMPSGLGAGSDLPTSSDGRGGDAEGCPPPDGKLGSLQVPPPHGPSILDEQLVPLSASVSPECRFTAGVCCALERGCNEKGLKPVL